MTMKDVGIDRLSPEQRIALALEIWESLGDTHPAACLTPEQRAEARQIATELGAIARSARILPGTIVMRRTRCGRPGCKCMADPPRPHGPYWQWTRKIAAKTVGRWLSAEQASDYEPWIANHRRVRELLSRLEAIGMAAFDADPRSAHGFAGSESRTGTCKWIEHDTFVERQHHVNHLPQESLRFYARMRGDVALPIWRNPTLYYIHGRRRGAHTSPCSRSPPAKVLSDRRHVRSLAI